MARRYSKDITYEDCKRFKAEHPDLTRMAVKNHHTVYAIAMERLGCLDELYPAVTYPKPTYEDYVASDTEARRLAENNF